MNQIKLHWNNLEDIKQMYSVLVDTYEAGAIFIVTDLEKIIYKQVSAKFDPPGVEVGDLNKAGGVSDQVIKKQEVIDLSLAENVYGTRAIVTAGPLWSDDEKEVLGAWALVKPKVNKVVEAFDFFAPIIIEMFPGGGAMYVTDREKFLKHAGSDNFRDNLIPDGTPIKEGDLTYRCIQEGRYAYIDVTREVYGAYGRVSAYPLKDDDTQEMIGSFTLALPREIEVTLKEMAVNMEKGLSEVSAAMEEMAAAASEVSANQDGLHQEIEKVQNNANEINTVLAFIKEIADETKMLGLNAAIEAARAGDAGRGFGVVAEEIRKLSDESKETVVQIKELLDRVNAAIEKTMQMSNATLSNTQQVAATTEEVNASLEEMSSLAIQLDATAAQL
ncbi:Methyl-accepting chemotaxis protein (MCP) signalling domain [Syntrophomonas zehnderi OL-4]|uniref:Methyl-accepting chemotaxis protein (MCP) signalling domain n=1 Tax=Syntrophomonas zehnderi OL-4 TaxID=690567 RepID=A0A0E4GE86_9FIRM|nr:methyl-accepting chemotaxis protein [Syntrophomonas zehnderi]CFX78242.1 Methyl-accepting chemotaxis protein (MCP) signalling domain [Syntrophomonas zehnderi OL-4]